MSPRLGPPLASRPGAEVVWTDAGPRSARFDDIYYAADGLAEARAVFLQGCGLPEAWIGRRRFTVAELGFGTGLNVLALLQLWRKTRPPGGRLHIFSVEAHPLSASEAARALAAFPELAELAAPLLARWPGRTTGFERIELTAIHAVVDVATAEAAEALRTWDGTADAWFLDGFAPARNPEMWRDEVLELVAARSAPDARLASFTIAGAVRRGLGERGFTVTRAPGHGRKRERLEARRAGAVDEPRRPERIAVVGGGIGGASLARAVARLGGRAAVIDPSPGGGASGNPAALVSPRLDAGGGAAARLYAQAFARAVDLYRSEVPDAVAASGALKLVAGITDWERFGALAQSELFREGSLAALDRTTASERLGEPCEGALWMEDALTLAPDKVLGAWLADADVIEGEATVLERVGGGWRIADADGRTIIEAEAVCLSAGPGLARWRAEIKPVQGQASWTREAALPGAPASWGGYALPLPGGGVLFGATHERGVTEAMATAEADARNLETLRARLPGLAARLEGASLGSRASLRASTPDRLPIAGAIGDGLFVLGGLGGRGFTTAPLLAEHVAAKLFGAASPLPLPLGEVVAPDRFEIRAARRSRS